MAEIKVKGQKQRYAVLDDQCVGRSCLQLGLFQARGATMSGSRATGSYTPCCMWRAYHGCPDDKDERYSADLEGERKKNGYKNA